MSVMAKISLTLPTIQTLQVPIQMELLLKKFRKWKVIFASKGVYLPENFKIQSRIW